MGARTRGPVCIMQHFALPSEDGVWQQEFPSKLFPVNRKTGCRAKKEEKREREFLPSSNKEGKNLVGKQEKNRRAERDRPCEPGAIESMELVTTRAGTFRDKKCGLLHS